jgi:hypothetical protein
VLRHQGSILLLLLGGVACTRPAGVAEQPVPETRQECLTTGLQRDVEMGCVHYTRARDNRAALVESGWECTPIRFRVSDNRWAFGCQQDAEPSASQAHGRDERVGSIGYEGYESSRSP